jgi:ABC-2 type transport system permease protein
MRLLWAFLRRDWQLATSYRLASLLASAGALFTLTTFYFLSRTVGDSPLLRSRYGTDYFSFALVGLAGLTLLRALQRQLGARLREAQVDGSLEVLLASPHGTARLLVLLSAAPLVNAALRALVLLGAGALFFGARLQLAPLSFAAVLAATLAAFASLGLISAAFILVFKRGDPFAYALDALSYLFAGVVYPPEVLPPLLARLGRLLPATHALEGLRAAALQAAPLEAVLPSVGALLLFALALWPLALLAVSAARRHVERVGSLPHA